MNVLLRIFILGLLPLADLKLLTLNLFSEVYDVYLKVLVLRLAVILHFIRSRYVILCWVQLGQLRIG